MRRRRGQQAQYMSALNMVRMRRAIRRGDAGALSQLMARHGVRSESDLQRLMERTEAALRPRRLRQGATVRMSYVDSVVADQAVQQYAADEGFSSVSELWRWLAAQEQQGS